MPEIQPFAALRYNPEINALASVVVPPYDVIKDEERRRLAAEPYSGVRLTLSEELPGDNPEHNRYTRARDLFETWQQEEILLQDDSESLYVLAQEFDWNGRRYTRTHLVCACRLHEWADGAILPHEQILEGPKDDRQRLIETTRANFEPLFALTMGDSHDFRSLLRRHSEGEPIQDVELANGERNRVWRVAEAGAIAAFQAALENTTLVIADGHHRYTASLGVKRALETEYGTGPWDYAMMTLAAMEDDDLLVLPTHRIVSGLPGFDFTALVDHLDTSFVVEEQEGLGATLAAMEAVDGVAIGMLTRENGAHLLTPWQPEAIGDLIAGEHSAEWKRLDVSILHGVIMDKVLGIGAGESPHIAYTRDASEAASAVQSGAAQVAFLLKSTPKAAVETIARLGETMPQKSTFFFPKLLTGMLMRRW
ncbi:MAG TPA: DUF1015 domain-containing protein [Armatimonadota bacterium]|jgi:uncharacterized protein (DUF1015 family)